MGPRGRRGTTMSLARRNNEWSVPGTRPMLTPNSAIGICFNGVPVAEARVMRLSCGTVTIAHRPKGTGGRWGLNPLTSSLGVEGDEALQMLLFSDSHMDCSSKSEHLGGKLYGNALVVARARSWMVKVLLSDR